MARKKAQRQNPSFATAYRCLASAFGHLGRDAEAREAAARVLEFDPAFPFDFCLPTKSTSVPSGPDWLHEIKYDGYRLRLERFDCSLTVEAGFYERAPGLVLGDKKIRLRKARYRKTTGPAAALP